MMHSSVVFHELIYVQGRVKKEKQICTEVQGQYLKEVRMTVRFSAGKMNLHAWPEQVSYCLKHVSCF